MNKIGVLTSGGDAPGMNAAIRAIVRTALDKNMEVLGFEYGYEGLIEGNFKSLQARDVGNIIQQAGTMLGSMRCPEFETEQGQEQALATLEAEGVDALVVIGGNGSQAGACALHKLGYPVVGVASTIDNDLAGSEITIGVDTALNVALESIDRLRASASSHKRATIVEVMGRNCGYLALKAGLTGGAEAIVIPESEIEARKVAEIIKDAYRRGKTHALVVVAEGAQNDANTLHNYLVDRQEELGFQLRTTILGHVQRGGKPTAFDRMLGTRLGAGAVDALNNGETGVLVGWQEGEPQTTPYERVIDREKPIKLENLRLAQILAQ